MSTTTILKVLFVGTSSIFNAVGFGHIVCPLGGDHAIVDECKANWGKEESGNFYTHFQPNTNDVHVFMDLSCSTSPAKRLVCQKLLFWPNEVLFFNFARKSAARSLLKTFSCPLYQSALLDFNLGPGTQAKTRFGWGVQLWSSPLFFKNQERRTNPIEDSP